MSLCEQVRPEPVEKQSGHSFLSMSIHNLQDLLSQRKCGEETFAQLKRNTYKFTSCGAWIHESDWGIALGSIVEGVDEGTETHTLNYPFTIEEFWKALESVEDQAQEIWNATHGCEDCGDECVDTGYTPINPECKTCEGFGTII